MFRRKDRLTTQYHVMDKNGDATAVGRLIAAPNATGRLWCVRAEGAVYDSVGGGGTGNPFSLTALARDAFHGFADYTLTRDEAIERMRAFEKEYPEISGDYRPRGRIPAISPAPKREYGLSAIPVMPS